MKNFLKFIFLGLWILTALSCKSVNDLSTDDHKISFRLVQLNDVYEIAPLEGGKTGGMARVATVVNQLRNEQPNTYLFMAGDFLNPSLLGTLKVNGERIRGKQMVEVMNAMKFDLVAFGNHEFDLKYKDLQKRINESNFDWVLGNALHHKNGKTVPFYKEREAVKNPIPQTKLIAITDADGTQLKLGVFSEIVNSNPKDYVRYQDPFMAAKRDYKNLKKQGADLVIGLTHLTKETDLQLLDSLPDVPLIIGGHEHYHMLLTAGSGGKVAKADANAKTIYVHDFTYNTKTKKWTLKSRLIPINDQIIADSQIEPIVEKWQKILQEKVQKVAAKPDEIIYYTKDPLDAREKSIRHHQTNFGVLVTKAMLKASAKQAAAAFVNSGSIRIDDQLQGNIAAIDIFRALPFGGSIYDVQMQGSLLKQVLDYGESHRGKGSYLQRSPNLRKGKDGEWLLNDKPIESGKNYWVTTSDYLLKGYDIPFLESGNKSILNIDKPDTKEDLRSDIRQAIIAYLKQ